MSKPTALREPAAPPSDDQPLSGAPSGVTEPGTKRRRTLLLVLAAIAVALVVIWLLIAVVFGSTQDGANGNQNESVVPAGVPPAQTLQQNPQTDKLGADAGGG